MNMGKTRLQELREQKRAIEREMRTLMMRETKCGKAMLRQHQRPTCRDGEWAVALEQRYVGRNVFEPDKTRFFDIAISMDRTAVINEIENIITDLVALREKAKENE